MFLNSDDNFHSSINEPQHEQIKDFVRQKLCAKSQRLKAFVERPDVRVSDTCFVTRHKCCKHDSFQLGLIVSERAMGIPPQISVPMYQTIFNEIRKARAKRLPFDFTHYIVVAKCYKE